MAGTKGKTLAFACEQCKSGKRKCDGIKPKCSLCSRLGKPCTYVEQRPKKRKYWDEDYVKGLEQQVQALLAVVRQYERQFGTLPSSETAPLPLIKGLIPDEHHEFESNLVNYRQHEHSDGLEGPISLAETLQNHEELPQFPTHERSPVALEELSVMMWRMNLGDGAVITQDGDSALSYEIAADCAVESSHISPPDEILRYIQDASLLSKLASVFLDNINQEHQFTPYTSTSFLDQYPYQRIDGTFLHTAILATGAAFLASRDPNMAKVGEDFAKVSYGTPTLKPWIRYSPHPLRSLLWHSKSGFWYQRSSNSTPSSARNHTDYI
ncbi:hypothetical protein CGMCC3_g1821 [Colletotrichum fructicola]|uniref:Quinic acid utilization activator n=1 Tax=Colletotrichum fructicola (strain Nara gc5) TaxID=1213859 RepID=A0A7J6J5H1_COLFN|nr:uncharacterized protein CGMCC3_g1821 [Colletotrichum fructicola]KAE9582280.1 hypothetical protein CGMCC3_g1821 [Colletotrichum fructicola]KAF4485080.1 Quinic acid utilization activator [Colletotrichum fructicola Nara gc5]